MSLTHARPAQVKVQRSAFWGNRQCSLERLRGITPALLQHEQVPQGAPRRCISRVQRNRKPQMFFRLSEFAARGQGVAKLEMRFRARGKDGGRSAISGCRLVEACRLEEDGTEFQSGVEQRRPAVDRRFPNLHGAFRFPGISTQLTEPVQRDAAQCPALDGVFPKPIRRPPDLALLPRQHPQHARGRHAEGRHPAGRQCISSAESDHSRANPPAASSAQAMLGR